MLLSRCAESLLLVPVMVGWVVANVAFGQENTIGSKHDGPWNGICTWNCYDQYQEPGSTRCPEDDNPAYCVFCERDTCTGDTVSCYEGICSQFQDSPPGSGDTAGVSHSVTVAESHHVEKLIISGQLGGQGDITADVVEILGTGILNTQGSVEARLVSVAFGGTLAGANVVAGQFNVSYGTLELLEGASITADLLSVGVQGKLRGLHGITWREGLSIAGGTLDVNSDLETDRAISIEGGLGFSGEISGGGSLHIRENGTLTANSIDSTPSTISVPIINAGKVAVGSGTLKVEEHDYVQNEDRSSTVLGGLDSGDFELPDAVLEITKSGGTANIRKGRVEGKGTIRTTAGKVLNEGTLSPGFPLEAEGACDFGTGEPKVFGKIRIEGDYEQADDGVLEIDVAGEDENRHDEIAINGKATLRGAIRIRWRARSGIKEIPFLTASDGLDAQFTTFDPSYSIEQIGNTLKLVPRVEREWQVLRLSQDTCPPSYGWGCVGLGEKRQVPCEYKAEQYTINKAGCVLTSFTMMVNALAASQSLTPPEVNGWLDIFANRGPCKEGCSPHPEDCRWKTNDVSWDLAVEELNRRYPGSGPWRRVHLSVAEMMRGAQTSCDQATRVTEVIANLICSNVPVAVRVPKHTVVAHNVLFESNRRRIQVADPGDGGRQYLDDVTAAKGAVQYVDFFEPAAFNRNPGVVTGSLWSPAELLVTDSLGRRTGFDPATGSEVAQIPGVSYWADWENDSKSDPTAVLNRSDAHKILRIEGHQGETFRVDVLGTGIGEAYFVASQLRPTGATDSLLARTIVVSPGSVDTMDLAIPVPTPSKLAFGQQPTSSPSGVILAPSVTVFVLDEEDTLVQTSGMTVAVQLGSSPPGATLSGTLVVPVVDGVATFSDLVISQPGSGYTLVATTEGLASGVSEAFDVANAACEFVGWTSLSRHVVSFVGGLAVYGGKLIAAGSFGLIGSVPAANIAQWDGDRWTPLGGGLSTAAPGSWPPVSMAVYGGKLVVGRSQGVDNLMQWDGSQWSTLGGGVTAAQGQFGGVTTLAEYGGKLVAGGSFTAAGAITVNNIAQWDGLEWSPLGSGLEGPVLSTAAVGQKLFAAGSVGSGAPYLMQWEGVSWNPVPDFPPGGGQTSSLVRLCEFDEKLAVALILETEQNRVTQVYLWDGTLWTPLGGQLDGALTALTVNKGMLYAAGFNDTSTFIPRGFVSRWDGAGWSSLGPGSYLSWKWALIPFGEDLVAAGGRDNITLWGCQDCASPPSPGIPAVTNVTADSFQVSNHLDDPDELFYAFRFNNASFFQPDGTMGPDPAWQTRSQWATLTAPMTGTSLVDVQASFDASGSCPSAFGPVAVVTFSCSLAAPSNARASHDSICSGQTVQLNADAPDEAVVEWSASACDGPALPGGSSPAVAPAATTTYYARSRSTTSDCTSWACAEITVHVHGVVTPASFQGLGDRPANSGSSIDSNFWDADPRPAHNVSDDGNRVVGYTGMGTAAQSYVWQDGARAPLDNLEGGSGSWSLALSGDGKVSAGLTWAAWPAPSPVACRWENGVIASLGSLPGYESQSVAYAASATGSVLVGFSGRHSFPFKEQQAFRWHDGVMTPLGYLSPEHKASNAFDVAADGSVAVGYSGSMPLSYSGLGGEVEAARWEDHASEGLGFLHPGDTVSFAYGVSADGSVVVGRSGTDRKGQAFRWQDGVMTGLGYLHEGDDYSTALDTSADGAVVVGAAGVFPSATEAFMWDADHGMRRVRDVLLSYGVDPGPWDLNCATAVSADGTTIVGFGYHQSGGTAQVETWIARLPRVPAPIIIAPDLVCSGSTGHTAFISEPAPGAVYEWAIAGGTIVAPAAGTSIVWSPGPGSRVSLSATALKDGCATPAGTLDVGITPLPPSPAAGSNAPLLVGDSLHLTATSIPGASYSWTGPGGFVSTEQNPVITDVDVGAAGMYSVTVTVNGCMSAPAETTVVITVPPCTITAWELAALHGPAGKLHNPISDGYVECRTAGIRELRLTFDQALDPATVGTGAVTVNGSKAGDLSSLIHRIPALEPGGQQMTVLFSQALPDADTFTIEVGPGVQSATGGSLTGSRTLCISALAGDANSNGTVTAQDLLAVQLRIGQTVDASNARYDVNGNGLINAQDLLAVKNKNGGIAASCP
ncbi:MAG: hypothetical protein AMXMBFR13_04240 [Phycisphaerae bacterium]